MHPIAAFTILGIMAVGSGLVDVASNASFLVCKDQDETIKDISWLSDKCVDIPEDLAVIVDLKITFSVTILRLRTSLHIAGPVKVMVGNRLANCTDLIDGKVCVSVQTVSTSMLHCAQPVTGRFVVISNKSPATATMCVAAIWGYIVSIVSRTAYFSDRKPVGLLSSLPMKKSNLVSKIDCARYCVQEDKCFTFTWVDGLCFWYAAGFNDFYRLEQFQSITTV